MADDLLSFKIVDSEGNSKTTLLPIPTGQTVANVTAYAQAMALDIGVVTGGELTDITWTTNIALPGGMEAGHPITGDLIETGAELLMDSGQRYHPSFYIPAIQNDKLQGKTIIVDADVVALHEQLVATVNTITATDGMGNALTAFIKATKSIRRK